MSSTETEIWRNQEVWIYKEREERKEDGSDNKEWFPGVIESMEIIKNENENKNIHKFKIKINESNNFIYIEETPPQGDSTEYVGFKKRQSTMNPKTCTDMTLLLNLNEPEIIECLRRRFAEKLIYTSIGPILVAVNPFERLNHLYEPLINQYFGKSIQEVRQLGPHIYQLSEVAYQKMFVDKFDSEKRENQSILVNGESGAGKTESTKQVLRYLTNISTIVAKSLRKDGVDIPDDDFEKMIIAANPITESFGNAKTSRNNNSSRFGKFIELNYSADGYIEGASITTYLLETVRLVRQMPGERNYHIFYEAFQGLSNELKTRWSFNSLNDFLYTNQSGEFNRHDGESDIDNFQALTNALSQCGLNEIKKNEVFGIVVGILHLGNITFVPSEKNGVEVSKSCDFHLNKIEELLGINRDHLILAVTKKSVVIAQNVIMKDLNEVDSAAARDSFSKILYDYLFKWLIQQVNISLKCSIETRSSFIGVLDIFGFEYFATNSFEQLCINYANEKLQDHFNYATFKSEQDVYKEENIKWKFIEYPDNSRRLELFENKTVGLFALCDENLKIPSPSDDKLSTSFYTKHIVENSYLSANPVSQRKKEFTIKHFACDVTYSVIGFLDKNRSEISSLINDCMNNSSIDIVNELLNLEDITSTSQRRMTRGTSLMGRSPSSSKQSQQIKPGLTVTKKTPTVASQFSSQLKDLITKIKTTTSHFIRCIKPNASLEREKFNKRMVMDQIRCGGALGAVQVLRAGFPNRMEFSYFVNRYSALMWVCGKNRITDDILKFDYQARSWSQGLRNPLVDSKIQAFLLIRSIPLTVSVLNRLEGVSLNVEENEQNLLIEGVQMGKTRIFLRANAFEYLERLHLRAKICSTNYLKKRWKARKASRSQGINKSRRRTSQTVIESMMYFTEYTRSRILKEVWAHSLLQRRGRIFIDRRRFKRIIRLTILLQTRIRMFIAYRLLSRLRWDRRNKACIRIQTVLRRWVAEKKYKRQVCSALKIQLFVRVGFAKRQVKSMRKDKADKEQRERELKASIIINMFCRRGIVKYRIEKRRLKSIEEKNRVDLEFAGRTISELRKKVEELESEVNKKDERIVELSNVKTNVSEYESNIDLLKKELEIVKEENRELREKSKVEIEYRDENIRVLEENKSESMKKIKELEMELLNENEKIRKLEIDLKDKVCEVKEVEVIVEKEVKVVDKDKDEIIDKLERELKEKNEKINELESSINKSNNTRIDDNNNGDNNVYGNNVYDNDNNNNNTIIIKENESESIRIIEYEERINKLERELKEKNEKINELESSQNNHEDNNSISKVSNTFDNKNIESKSEETPILTSSISTTLSTSNEERISKLERELEEKNEKINELESKLKLLQLNEGKVQISDNNNINNSEAVVELTELMVKSSDSSPENISHVATNGDIPELALTETEFQASPQRITEHEVALHESISLLNNKVFEYEERIELLQQELANRDQRLANAAHDNILVDENNRLREELERNVKSTQEYYRKLADMLHYVKNEVGTYHKEMVLLQSETYGTLVTQQEAVDTAAKETKLSWFQKLIGRKK